MVLLILEYFAHFVFKNYISVLFSLVACCRNFSGYIDLL